MVSEQRIGTVANFAPKPQAAIVELEAGRVRVGDTIHIKGPGIDLFEEVSSIHFERRPVEEATEGQRIGIRVSQPIEGKPEVYLVHGEAEVVEGPRQEAETEDDAEARAARLALQRREVRRAAQEGRTEGRKLSDKKPDPKLTRDMHDFWG